MCSVISGENITKSFELFIEDKRLVNSLILGNILIRCYYLLRFGKHYIMTNACSFFFEVQVTVHRDKFLQ